MDLLEYVVSTDWTFFLVVICLAFLIRWQIRTYKAAA